MQWLRLERTFKDLIQTLCNGQGHLKLDQVAQSPFHSHFLPYIQCKSALCQYKTIDPHPVTTDPDKKIFSFFLMSPFLF